MFIVGKSSQRSNQLWHCWCTAPYINDDGSSGTYRVMGNTRYPQCELPWMLRENNTLPKSKGDLLGHMSAFALKRAFSLQQKHKRNQLKSNSLKRLREQIDFAPYWDHLLTWVSLEQVNFIKNFVLQSMNGNIKRILSTGVSQQCFSTWRRQEKMPLMRLQMKNWNCELCLENKNISEVWDSMVWLT